MSAESSGPGPGQEQEGILHSRGDSDFTDLIGGAGKGQQQQSGEGGQQQQQQQEAGGAPAAKTPSKPAGTEGEGKPKTEGAPATAGAEGAPVEGEKKPAATSSFDPKVIEDIVAASVAGAKRGSETPSKTEAAAPRQMTDAEWNERYKIQTIDAKVITALMDTDPAKAAAVLNSIMTGNMRSAVLMAKDMFESQLKTYRDEVAPDISAWRTHQAEIREQKAQDAFYKKYPDLANERELVKEMTDALHGKIKTGQISFKTEAEAFEAVAQASRKLLARMNKSGGNGAAGTGTQSQQQQQSSSRQMTAASSAGHQGTGRTATPSDEEKIFGKDWV